MALDENVLFTAIYARMGDRPVEEVVAEVVKAKRAFDKAEASDDDGEKPQVKPPTRRCIKHDPESAVTEDAIVCCVCGQAFQSLTSRHLVKHGLTPEEYRRLCGYDPDMALMSLGRFRQMQDSIAKAQESRRGSSLRQDDDDWDDDDDIYR